MKLRKAIIFTTLVCLILMGSAIYPEKAALAAFFVDDTSIEQSIAMLADSLEGSSYKLGGNTPSGFDTSGFVEYVFKNSAAKLTLPRTVAEQFKKGTSVKQSDLLLGDLVFFKIDGKIQDVGISLCDNDFITVTKKEGVKWQRLDNPYWKKRYYGAKRLIQPPSETKKLIQNINTLADQGKVINCDFGLGTKKEEITKKWGQPDTYKELLSGVVVMCYKERGYCFLTVNGVVYEISVYLKGIRCTFWDVQKVLGGKFGEGEWPTYGKNHQLTFHTEAPSYDGVDTPRTRCYTIGSV